MTITTKKEVIPMHEWVSSSEKRDGQVGLGLGLTTDQANVGREKEERQTQPDNSGVVPAEGLGAMTDANQVQD